MTPVLTWILRQQRQTKADRRHLHTATPAIVSAQAAHLSQVLDRPKIPASLLINTPPRESI
jgi:hypothetical protein